MIANEYTAFFTVCNSAYLSRTITLAESLYRQHGNRLNIFVFDKERQVSSDSDAFQIHWAENLRIPGFSHLAFKYNVIELTTAMKPWIALRLLEHHSKVIFFDPDVMLFARVDPVIDCLNNHPVVLSPHYHKPKMDGLIDDERLLKFGGYNLGFFASNDSEEARGFLEWWSERCFKLAFDDTAFGVFTDQKWVSIAHSLFPFIYVSLHDGLNVAYWNLGERNITKSEKGQYYVNEDSRLLFLHFSSFDCDKPERLSSEKYDLGSNSLSIIGEIGRLYGAQLQQNGNVVEDTVYSYDFMTDGRYITPTLRRAYAAIWPDGDQTLAPFDSGGIVARFGEKNRLFEKRNNVYKKLGYESAGENAKKIRVAYICMRLALYVMGPNRFMNFTKLLVYLSGLHRIPDMWKHER